MSITVKSPRGGFVVIIPVAGCAHCPFRKVNGTAGVLCGHDYAVQHVPEFDRYLDGYDQYAFSHSTMPDCCPAIAEAQNELPGTADLDFLLNDAIESLKGEQP